MNTLQSNSLRFFSKPYEQKLASIPMSIAIGCAWILVILGTAAACMALPVDGSFGFMMIAASGALALFLVFVTRQWLEDCKQRHELSLDGDKVTLVSVDATNHERTVRQIRLSEVDSAEYYTPKDTAVLFLKGANNSLGIPLWTFGPEAEKRIVDHVKARGTSLVSIPNEIVV